jgi:benzodiazapine receptor
MALESHNRTGVLGGLIARRAPTSAASVELSPLLISVAPTVAAALLGNALVGRDALKWLEELHKPRMQLPLPGFLSVGALYYVSIGTVLHRSAVRSDHRAYRLAAVVLVANETWNVILFGRRSTRGAFLGVLASTVPVALLQSSVREDRFSMVALAPLHGLGDRLRHPLDLLAVASQPMTHAQGVNGALTSLHRREPRLSCGMRRAEKLMRSRSCEPGRTLGYGTAHRCCPSGRSNAPEICQECCPLHGATRQTILVLCVPAARSDPAAHHTTAADERARA